MLFFEVWVAQLLWKVVLCLLECNGGMASLSNRVTGEHQCSEYHGKN